MKNPKNLSIGLAIFTSIFCVWENTIVRESKLIQSNGIWWKAIPLDQMLSGKPAAMDVFWQGFPVVMRFWFKLGDERAWLTSGIVVNGFVCAILCFMSFLMAYYVFSILSGIKRRAREFRGQTPN